MNQELVTIKRLIIKRHYAFTEKALSEMDRDNLSEEDILESILNAQFLRTKRSTSPFKQRKKEKVYSLKVLHILVC